MKVLPVRSEEHSSAVSEAEVPQSVLSSDEKKKKKITVAILTETKLNQPITRPVKIRFNKM